MLERRGRRRTRAVAGDEQRAHARERRRARRLWPVLAAERHVALADLLAQTRAVRVVQRRRAGNEQVHQTTERPDVDGGAVLGVARNLWRLQRLTSERAAGGGGGGRELRGNE